MEYGNVLLFPDARGKAQASAYAERYLREAKREGVPMFTWESPDVLRKVAAKSVMSRPPTLDRKSAIAAVPAAARSLLERKESLLVGAMRRAFPALDDEQVTGESVSVTDGQWHGVPANALVYERTTSAGSLIVVSAWVRVDPDSGALTYAPAPAAPRVEKIPAGSVLAAASGLLDTLKGVINLAGMVLFACGPEGIVAATGLGILELMVRDGQKKVDIPRAINDLVVQDFANDHVKKDLATIVGYTQWLAEQNRKALSGEMPDKDKATYQDAYDELKQYVVNACDPGSALRQAVSDLRNGTYTSDPPFDVLGFPAFLLGAFTHLMFEKCRILFSTDATSFRSPITYDLVNAAKDYLDYAQAVVKEIEVVLAERLGGVSGVTQGDHVELISTPTRDMAVPRHYIYFTDANASKWPPKPVQTGDANAAGLAKNVVWYSDCMPKGCGGVGTCDSNDCEAAASARAQYVLDVTTKLQGKYNYRDERRKDLAQAIAKLQNIVDTYKAAAPPTS